MLLFQPEQADLLVQRLLPVKGGTADDVPDLPKGEFQLPEKQDALQAFQGRIVIQPVACLRDLRGTQKPDPVIVVEGAYTHPRQSADLMDRHHG